MLDNARPKIFITGATGQVGYELVHDLAPMGDILAPTRAELDLSEPVAVNNYLQKHQPEIVISTAAYTHVDKAEEERDAAYRLNTELPKQLAQYCGDSHWLVHFSSDYVYPGTGDTPYVETDATGPLSYYGLTKRYGDDAVQAHATKHYILRTSWVYSYRGNNFLRTMLRLAETHTELRVVNDQIGTPTSAFFLSKVTQRFVQHILDNEPAESGIYHTVPSGYTSWAGFAAAIFEVAVEEKLKVGNINLVDALGFILDSGKPKILPIPSSEFATKAMRPSNSRLNINRLSNNLSFEPRRWQEELRSMVREIKARE